MTTSPLVFIGLVTHPNTRFKDSQTATGVTSRLDAELRRKGISVFTTICAENLCDYSISRYTTAESKLAQKAASTYWKYYLLKQCPPIYKLAAVFIKGLASAFQDFFSKKAQTATRRLINIELAHLSLMQQALKARASWAIIIEDDATCDNIEDLADGILGIIGSTQEPSYINLSLSFTPKQLKVESLLQIDPNFRWKGTVHRSIMRSNLPITNTVCAVAYAASFLRDLLQVMEGMGTFPVLPIDWKLNIALIKLYHTKSLKERFRGCLFVEPGPLIQGSLHQLPQHTSNGDD